MALTTRRRAASMVRAATFAAEMLEDRRLFAASVVQDLPDAVGNPNSTQGIDLQQYFTDPTYSVVRITTPQGAFDVQTLDEAVPANATNFLSYVTSGSYDGAIFHRYEPGFVLQGGSVYDDGTPVPTFDPVADEPSPLSNVRGTLAFARLGGDPNSGTSGFFVNLGDNSANLDNQNGGFAVFGFVRGNGMSVVDAAAAVVANNPNNAPIQSAILIDDVTYTVTSSDSSIVSASIVDDDLMLSYGGTEGSATITVTATDLDGVTTAQSSFIAAADITTIVGEDTGVKSISYVDADGTKTTVTVKGAGVAQLSFDGANVSETVKGKQINVDGSDLTLSNIVVSGSNAKTVVTISSKGGDGTATVAGFSADSDIKAIVAKGVVLTGELNVPGAVGSLTVAGATDTSITLGGSATDRGSALSLGEIIDTSVFSTGTVKSVKVDSVQDRTGAADAFTAPSIGSLSSSSSMAWDVTATDDGVIGNVSIGGNMIGDWTAGQFGRITVKGDLTESTLTSLRVPAVNPDAKSEYGIGSIKVGGAFSGVTVSSVGTIGSLQSQTMDANTIVAGAPSLTSLPTAVGDFEFDASIKSLKVKDTFASSNVVAKTLGKFQVGTLLTDNAGVQFGIAGDTLASFKGKTDAGTKFSVKKADTQADVDADLAGVLLGDALVIVL